MAVRIINADVMEGLRQLPDESVHCVVTDPPYGTSQESWDVLHNNTNAALLGSSPAQKRSGAIFKSRGKPINGWSVADRDISKEFQDWCGTWAGELLRVMLPGSSAFVFAARRHAHRAAVAFEDSGFLLRDVLAWEKIDAPHRAQRVSAVYERRGDGGSADEWRGWKLGNLRPMHEPILWLMKPYKIGSTIADNAAEHGLGPYNEDGFLRYFSSADTVIRCGLPASECVGHPTQKPTKLVAALIELCSRPGHLVLDPFLGSGTTALAAANLKREFVGIELNPEYAEMSQRRINQDRGGLLDLMEPAE